MHVASYIPPAPYHTRPHPVRPHRDKFRRRPCCHRGAACSAAPREKATRRQGKFKGSGSLADPRVSSMQARPAPKGRVREILRVMQFNRQLARRQPGVSISTGDWGSAFGHAGPETLSGLPPWCLLRRRRGRSGQGGGGMLIIIIIDHGISTRQSVSIVPRPMPGVPRQAWFVNFTTLVRSSRSSTGMWGCGRG